MFNAEEKIQATDLGEGPERERIVSRIQKHGLVESVSLLGQIKEPFDYLATADYFVLPSHSEGTSRAAMEALYAGVPCIMRDVDSNADLISSPKQGELFSDYDGLVRLLFDCCCRSRSLKKENLLPSRFSQEIGAQRYLDLINILN